MNIFPKESQNDEPHETDCCNYWPVIFLQECAAENPATSPIVLKLLAQSVHPKVRMAVADNPNASEETLLELAHDKNADIRYQLAENHNVSEKVLLVLAEDSHPFIAERAQKTLKRLSAIANLESGSKVVAIPNSRASLEHSLRLGARTKRGMLRQS